MEDKGFSYWSATTRFNTLLASIMRRRKQMDGTQKISGGQKRQPKQEPTIGGSTYVRPQEMEWQETQFEKVWLKVLYENREKGESTVLIKLEPGAYLPFHVHPELEQAYVIEGSMYDHDGICKAGEYVWRKAGSYHDNRSDTGAVILGVYRKQNIFVGGVSGYRSKAGQS
jgi:quercetin dioxygenase-like cupin family protein